MDRFRVGGVPAGLPSGVLLVGLIPQGGLGSRIVYASVESDGAFEFSGVEPGRYTARTYPTATPSIPVEVGEKDILGLGLTPGPLLLGRVVIEEGGRLPIQAEAVAAGTAYPPALVKIDARPATPDSLFEGDAIVGEDGLFVLAMPAGAPLHMRVTTLPFGYYLKAMTYDSNDLLRSPLEIGQTPPKEVRILLTKTPPPGTPRGVSVSGRVTGVAHGTTSPLWIHIRALISQAALSSVNPIRIVEVPVGPEGTFEASGIPPGSYVLRTVPSLGSSVRVTVTDRDIIDVEISAPR